MAHNTLKIEVQSASETETLGRLLAQNLQPGDTVLLNGSVGAGKTHFARALIKALLVADEDIPSPTFTLVQTYDTRIAEVWHADLYRLSEEQEIEELGLSDAMIDAVCLIEWPDRLGSYEPDDALNVSISTSASPEQRSIEAKWTDTKWADKTKGWQND